jgi:hypothetical protein
VQRNAFNAELTTSLAELRGPIPSPHGGKVGEQRSFTRQVFEQVQRFRAQI